MHNRRRGQIISPYSYFLKSNLSYYPELKKKKLKSENFFFLSFRSGVERSWTCWAVGWSSPHYSVRRSKQWSIQHTGIHRGSLCCCRVTSLRISIYISTTVGRASTKWNWKYIFAFFFYYYFLLRRMKLDDAQRRNLTNGFFFSYTAAAAATFHAV